MMNKGGFVIILVVAFLSMLVLTGLVIMNLGCGDLLYTKAVDDVTTANYVAISGAEMMYGNLKSRENQTITWPQSVPSSESQVRTRAAGGALIGTFSASANTAGSGTLGIVSTGTVNGRTATVAVRYGFTSSFTNGYPVACKGNMSLAGQKWFVLRSWVRAEGPLASGGTVSTNNFVKVSGDILQNQPVVTPSFWQKYDSSSGSWSSKTVFDTNGNDSFIPDDSERGYVVIGDCGGDPAKEAIFRADDIDGNNIIDDMYSFIAYYTVELNKMGLNIGAGQVCNYTGDQSFTPSSVSAGTPIIFVDGSVEILFNDSAWWGGANDHTIVATGDITIVQPTNGSNDTLTLVSWGDVNTGGVRAFGGVQGNLVVYANQDFNAYYGGRTDGTIFANGNVDIDTVLPIPGLLNRDLNRGSQDWSDPANWPLGLPPDFGKISIAFRFRNERSQYVPVWQRE